MLADKSVFVLVSEDLEERAVRGNKKIQTVPRAHAKFMARRECDEIPLVTAVCITFTLGRERYSLTVLCCVTIFYILVSIYC